MADRMEMLRAFDETCAGVKGLTDSGILKLPKIFVRPPEELSEESLTSKIYGDEVRVPVIDLGGDRRQVVEEVRKAAETWGFFQVVNHGVPASVLDGMIEAVRGFNEQDLAEKRKYYTRDRSKGVRFNCNYDLFKSRTASWRDTLTISVPIDPDQLPPLCRESTMEFSNHIEILGNILFGLLSEALGLETGHLESIGCSQGHRLLCHYYPACPEPDFAIGLGKHSDAGFLTILLQNQISALQVWDRDQWINIHPTPGGLVVNIGDLLQLVSNGKLRSSEHRAVATQAGPRISVACFFSGPIEGSNIYGPIEELITEENPPIYKKVVISDYVAKFFTLGLDNKYRALDYYKL